VTDIRVHLPGPAVTTLEPDAARNRPPDRSYDIVVGGGLLRSVGSAVRAAGGRRAVVVSDAAVAASHGREVARGLDRAGVETLRLEVPSGESAKSVAGAARLWDAFAAAAIDRQTHVVAVGGGVVGDLAGFVAATFARGLPVWQVPTTLVAQVDSAIGGKTGINLDGGKNLVGAFWQPRGVFADVDALASLPRREFTSGFAEVVKYGMIFDAGFVTWLEGRVADLLAREPGAVGHAVERSAAFKAAVVEEDERESTGARAALNYGHTFAHAFETAAGYGRLLHGEAVAIGMACAARLARLLGRVGDDFVARQDRLLAAFGLPTDPAAAGSVAADDLLPIMARDKKSSGGRLRFVLPDRIGRAELVAGVAPELVRAALDRP